MVIIAHFGVSVNYAGSDGVLCTQTCPIEKIFVLHNSKLLFAKINARSLYHHGHRNVCMNRLECYVSAMSQQTLPLVNTA